MNEEIDYLERLKKDYKPLAERYSLPSFDLLNEDFMIERIADSDTDFLAREVRRHMSEKISNALRVLDILINPSNTPLFLLPAIRAITKEEKCVIERIYDVLSRNEFSCVKMDLCYSLNDEVAYIKNSYTLWQSVKKDLYKLFSEIEKNWDKKTEK
jgi:hypothetical protein